MKVDKDMAVSHLDWQPAWEKYKEEHENPDWYEFADEYFGPEDDTYYDEGCAEDFADIGLDFDGDVDDDGSVIIPDIYNEAMSED